MPQVGRSELNIAHNAYQRPVTDSAGDEVSDFSTDGLPRQLSVVGQLRRTECGQGVGETER